MAIADQAGKVAAETISTGAQKVAASLSETVKSASEVLGADAADAVSDIVGAVERINATFDRQATEYLVQITRLNNNLERLLTKGLTLRGGE